MKRKKVNRFRPYRATYGERLHEGAAMMSDTYADFGGLYEDHDSYHPSNYASDAIDIREIDDVIHNSDLYH